MDDEELQAEQRARVRIDNQLSAAGWVVQDRKAMNVFAGQGGVAVREVIMAPEHTRLVIREPHRGALARAPMADDSSVSTSPSSSPGPGKIASSRSTSPSADGLFTRVR